MDHYETVWIKKEETNEVPNEPGSMFVEDPLDISCSPDFIKEEPEVILEVDETQNIVVSSPRYETDSTRLIQHDESCGISFEEPNNQAVYEELEKDTEESAHASTCGIHVQGLMSEDSVFGTKLKCCLREKDVQKFRCSLCPQSFPSKYRLTMHVFIHIDDVQPPTFVCKSCGDVFPSNVSLKRHLKMSKSDQGLSVGNDEKFDCSDDQKNIVLENVFVTEETEKQSSCKRTRKISKISFTDKCNTHTVPQDAEKQDRHDNYETSFRAGKFNNQAVKVNAKRIHRCDVCGKSFTRLNHFKSHALKHTGVKPYRCDICGKSFTQVGTLNRHTSIHTGKIPDRPHKCDVCGKYFTQLPHLKNHALIHAGIKPHKCEICGKCFTESITLKRHALIHTGVRSHKCDICGKSFTLLGDLNRHSLIHIGKSLNKCDVCGKSFARLDYLKRHALQHTGMSPHKCGTCGKSFTQLCILKRHCLIHLGMRPHKCDICGKSFTESGTLKKHALTHIGKTH